MKVTDALREAIEHAELNRRNIAIKTGVPESALSRFVRKERGLDGQSIDKLAEFFGLELLPKRNRKAR